MGTRFLLTSDSPVADAVKQVYLAAGLDGTVVTRRVDGVPHRVLRTPLVDRLERGGRVGDAGCGRRATRCGSGRSPGCRRWTCCGRGARCAGAARCRGRRC